VSTGWRAPGAAPDCAACSPSPTGSSPTGPPRACGPWCAPAAARGFAWWRSARPARGGHQAAVRRLPGGHAGRAAPVGRHPLPELVEALNAYQPQGLVGYPTLAGILAGEQLAGRLRIRPRFGLYGAEPLTPVIRRRIRQAWGFEPASIYAATEALAIGSSTPADECLEISEDVLVVEVVDQHDRPVPPGTPGARVLVTNLVDYAQPLIRYELSDVVTLADGSNPSGRPYRRIASIEGRRMDTLHLPRRGGGEVALHPTGLSPAFASLPEVREYQVLHDHRGLHVRVVLAPGADPATPERLRRALAAAVEAAGAVAPPVEVVEVDALEREPGPAAKLKLVKSTVPSRHAVPPG
jgi:phenylacetate-coenzyme A ligase PaaK-like adenylate-forming protein